MSEWKEYKLGDVVSISSGFAYKGELIGRGESFLLGMGCVSFKEKFLHSGARLYAGDCPDRYCAEVGDIILATRQQSDNLPILGMPAIIPDTYANKKLIIGANLYKVTNNSDFDNKYIYWLLKSVDYVRYIRSCQSGTSVRMITKANIENYTFKAPDKVTRDRISNILWNIEYKIDLLNRENVTLEAMAETLFRQWFIEEAKEDWEDVPLGDVIKTTSGGTPSRKHTEYYNDGTINWVKSKELQGTFISSTEELITEDAISNSSAKMLPVSSVLIAMYGATVGEYGILSKPMTCNQAVCALIPNDKYPYTYLFVWAALMKEDFINLASGAAQQNISQDLIKQQMVSGDLCLIKLYDEQVRAYFEKMECNQRQIMLLSKQRDILLPKLMSNEISI